MNTKCGIIGDTHGMLHPSVPELFKDVDEIIHTGDVGEKAVLDKLSAIAPVRAVKGNYDTEPGLSEMLLPDPSMIKIAGLTALLTHRMFTMGWDHTKELIAEQLSRHGNPVQMVVFGHTHFSVFEEISGIWFVNPGYCGPDPLEGPLSVIRLEIEDKNVSGEVIKI